MGPEFRQDYGQLQRTERSEMPVGSQLSSQSCFAKATNGFVSGTVLGATMSGLTGMARATQLQIRFPAAVQGVIGATIVGGLSFGVALGMYQGTACAIRQIRGVDDIANSMTAGALVGAMSEIPAFLRSKVVTKADVLLAEQGMHVMRPRPRFLTNAVGGAVVCGLFYMVGDAVKPAPSPKPQGSPQPPRPPTQGSNEGQVLDTWGSLEIQENDGDWVITEPPSGEVLESEEDLSWGSK